MVDTSEQNNSNIVNSSMIDNSNLVESSGSVPLVVVNELDLTWESYNLMGPENTISDEMVQSIF